MKSRSPSLSRVVLTLLALAVAACVSAFLPGASAQEGPSARANSRTISGNGRGLGTFSDRGLTTFGDRFSEGFGRRDLTSFSDIPLAPMGGLEIPGPSEARRNSRSGDSDGRRLRNHHPPRSSRQFDLSSSAFSDAGGTSMATGGHHAGRSVSIRGRVVSSSRGPAAPVVLPSVRLPSVTLDHRPALERLSLALRQELDRVERRGDPGVARALASSRLR